MFRIHYLYKPYYNRHRYILSCYLTYYFNSLEVVKMAADWELDDNSEGEINAALENAAYYYAIEKMKPYDSVAKALQDIEDERSSTDMNSYPARSNTALEEAAINQAKQFLSKLLREQYEKLFG